MKKLWFTRIMIGAMFVALQPNKESQAQSKKVSLAKSRYVDPNGFFKIVPPDGWKIQSYPNDPRGKVAFMGPEDVELRVLAKGLDHSSFDQMLEELESMEKRIGTTTNIEKTTFCGAQAVKRTFTIKGTKLLLVDFMIGNTTHNLMYSALPAQYAKYQSLAQQSIDTYEPGLDGVSPEDVKKHNVARTLRLGRLMMEMDRVDLALEYVREGLAVASENQELLKLKQEVDSRFTQPDEQETVAGGKRFESKKFGFVFNVPEKVNVYTADDPGPMAARIRADTPIWIVSSVIPTERINVKITEEATMSDLQQMLDISLYSGLSQYERVSVNEIEIGQNQDKPAYEHIHRLKLNPPKKLRQILFVHKGNAFGFTCSTSVDRYEAANSEFFDVIFRTMEFK